MIYDCFTFFNELDLLDIRLNYLNDYVDKFVLVEMGKTHSGNDKPMYFDENKALFEKFLDKIIHIKIEDYPDMDSYTDYEKCWCLENYQRDCIMRGLKDADDDDVIMISDLDEIPTIDVIKNFPGGIFGTQQKFMYYYLNCLNETTPIWTRGTKICNFENLIYPNFEITEDVSSKFTQKGFPTYIRYFAGPAFINGGWHFSYLGGTEAVIKKLKSFSHQEFNNEVYTNPENIERKIAAGEDILGRGFTFKTVPIDDSFPEYIVNNQEKFKHLILNV